jgi:hypothetical protein
METTTYVIFGLNPLYIDAQLYKKPQKHQNECPTKH